MNQPAFIPLALNPLDTWTARRLGLHGPLQREALQAWQLKQFAATLAWARQNSPFYRRHLAGIDTDLPVSQEALRRLPFTTAEDLQRNDPALLCVSQNNISRIVTLQTSGSSGNPKRLFFTPEDQEATVDFFHHGMGIFTRPKDRVAILFPCERPGSVGDLLVQALKRIGAKPIPMGWPHDVHKAAELFQREPPDVVAGSPVATLAVARAGDAISIRSVLLSADHVANSLRKALIARWGCEVFEHYGMTEMGLGGGVECHTHAGYHMRESELLVELVDPVSGEAVAPGEIGEIVFSTLSRRGMPLIRYRTGDLSRLIASPCPCGSLLMRLERIHGRVSAGSKISMPPLGIASLDEVLFTHEDILDFDARYQDSPQHLLHIQIAGLRSANELPALEARLANHPILAQAIQKGLHIKLSLATGNLFNRVGKRCITTRVAS